MPQRFDDRVAIGDGEDLWRRILPDPDWFAQRDDCSWRPSSASFLDRRTGEVSVHVSSLTTVDAALAGFPNHSLAAIKARIPRELGYAVAPDPIRGDPVLADDPSHALICPPPEMAKGKRKAHAREMALRSTWVVLCDPPYS